MSTESHGPASGHDQVRPLLDRFTADIGRVVRLTALWAHGSLALGDFQPGRSDLDLIALVGEPVSDQQRQELQLVHEALAADEPLAELLHCTYVAAAELADVSRVHATWAMSEMFDRRVSVLSRRELQAGGLALYGPDPREVVPPVSDRQLADYVRADLSDFWHPRTEVPHLWLREVWVDLGFLTLARASVTLQDGRLISKREAFDVLGRLGAPADVVRDIYQRRYDAQLPPVGDSWRTRRGELARSFVRQGIERVLAATADSDR